MHCVLHKREGRAFGTNKTWYHFLAIGKIGKTPKLKGLFLGNAKILGRENTFYQMNKTGSFPGSMIFLWIVSGSWVYVFLVGLDFFSRCVSYILVHTKFALFVSLGRCGCHVCCPNGCLKQTNQRHRFSCLSYISVKCKSSTKSLMFFIKRWAMARGWPHLAISQ